MDPFPYLLTPPFGLLPLLAASQPCFCLLQTEVDWDAGPTDDANVEANLPGPVRLGKWASIFVIVLFSLAPSEVAPSTSDFGPDMSFDTSAFPEYMSNLDRASLAKVVSHVSPSKIPKTISHQLF
ncbi:hypothetical protein Tco_0723417 [Tanacetum coccineum]